MYGTTRRFAWLLAFSAGLYCCSGADQPECLPLGTPCAYKPGYGTELCCQLPPPDDVICSCNKAPLGTCKLQALAEHVCCVSEGKCGCEVDTDCCGLSACNEGCCETGSKGAGQKEEKKTAGCLELGKGPCEYKPGYGTDLCCQPKPPDDRICGCTTTALGKCKASETVCCTSGGKCGCKSDNDCCGLSVCRKACCT